MESITEYEREIWRLQSRLERLLEPRYEEHARAVIARFKEITEGIRMSGDDSPLADAWEEYKDQVQGQESIYFDMFVLQLRELAAAYVDDLPRHEVELLWIGTQAFQDAEGEERHGYDPQRVVEHLCRTIDQIAKSEEIQLLGSEGDEEDVEEEEDFEEEDGDGPGAEEGEGALSREDARSIADEYARRAMGNDTRVGDVLTAQEALRAPSLYGFDVERCWIAYLKRPVTGLIRSSDIVLVSMLTGDVVYAGPANDEG